MAMLPSWYPSDHEPRAAPTPLLRVQAFLNTTEIEVGTDLLADDERAARAWLLDADLLPAGGSVSPDELSFARDVRESLRALLISGVQANLTPLQRLADDRAARLTVSEDGVLGLEPPDRERLADGMFELLLLVRSAQENGTWWRLKACANRECGWAFYDRSRNRQACWCDMASCGNRLKNQAYRARHG